jgi:hypothetical protein
MRSRRDKGRAERGLRGGGPGFGVWFWFWFWFWGLWLIWASQTQNKEPLLRTPLGAGNWKLCALPLTADWGLGYGVGEWGSPWEEAAV